MNVITLSHIFLPGTSIIFNDFHSTRVVASPFEVLKIPLPQKELGDQRLTIALIFTSKIFLI